ncbi:hypothetical protein ACSSS7_004985 [Eimeria intestinalis]
MRRTTSSSISSGQGGGSCVLSLNSNAGLLSGGYCLKGQQQYLTSRSSGGSSSIPDASRPHNNNSNSSRSSNDFANSSSRSSNNSSSSSSGSSLMSRALSHYCDVGTSYKWGERRSHLVGLSCFVYLLPYLCLSSSRSSSSSSSGQQAESYMWVCVTCFSFLSDYVFSGQRHSRGIRALHLADRWVASAALLLQCTFNLRLWFLSSFSTGAAGLILIFFCCFVKYVGALAHTFTQYAWAHTAWHLAGAASRCIMVFLEE